MQSTLNCESSQWPRNAHSMPHHYEHSIYYYFSVLRAHEVGCCASRIGRDKWERQTKLSSCGAVTEWKMFHIVLYALYVYEILCVFRWVDDNGLETSEKNRCHVRINRQECTAPDEKRFRMGRDKSFNFDTFLGLFEKNKSVVCVVCLRCVHDNHISSLCVCYLFIFQIYFHFFAHLIKLNYEIFMFEHLLCEQFDRSNIIVDLATGK